MRFSQRIGTRPVKTIVQRDSMDDALRNRLWSVLSTYCWRTPREGSNLVEYNADLKALSFRLWFDFFKEPTDRIPTHCSDLLGVCRRYFFESEWDRTYDLLEFAVTDDAYSYNYETIAAACNYVLEQELSGFRFVAGKLTPITEQEQIAAIESAIGETATPFPGAAEHIRTAIDLLTKKPKPDYRNSIKESISAVEALCVAITSRPKATLADALKVIGAQAELHGALRAAFDKLYGYTSDADGIRHALLDEDHLEQEDAVFMLVACSAFVSYVIAKRARKT